MGVCESAFFGAYFLGLRHLESGLWMGRSEMISNEYQQKQAVFFVVLYVFSWGLCDFRRDSRERGCLVPEVKHRALAHTTNNWKIHNLWNNFFFW